MFYSQFGEDRLLAQIFDDVREGLCVEVGANDGVNDSNTYYFEQIGWDCILVEPNPELCRGIREKRNSRLFECAVSSQPGTAVLNVADGPGRAHGVSSLGESAAAKSRIAAFGFKSRELTVPTRTLDDILLEAQVQQGLNFVSIDVEGHELEVLKGFSLSKWKPVIVILEDNSNCEDQTVAEYLRRFGYVPFRRTGVNDWYGHRSDRRVISMQALLGWRLAALRERLRSRARKIPGATRVVRLLRRMRRR